MKEYDVMSLSVDQLQNLILNFFNNKTL